MKYTINMKSNSLTNKRNVHVAMDHDVYVAMRKKLFESTLTFPECVQEFAQLIGSEDPLAMQLINRCYRNKLKRELESLKTTDKKVSFHELDSDALYNMIEESSASANSNRDRNEDD